MNAVTAGRWADYVRTSCSTCKPGPDGTWTGVGWTLIAVGAAVLLLGVGMLWFEARSGTASELEPEAEPGPESEPEPEASEPTAVMDKAQREDLERRAAQAVPDQQTTESEEATKSGQSAGGPVVGLGVGAALIGVIIMAFSASRVEDDKSQLRLAAANVLSTAVDGPAICRATAVVESEDLPSSDTQFLPNAADCGASPRKYAQQQNSSPAGVFIPVEYVFSTSFTTDGEVTVHDKQDNRSLCVTVPDTDVAAATASENETATATSTDSGPMPLFDDVTVDPDPYIKDGACPDAPVSSTNPQ